MKKTSTKKITQLALLACVSLMLSYVETFIPAIPIPGAKIGLPNIISIIILYSFGLPEAIVVMLIRTVIASFLFSSPVTLIYSIAGGLFSIVIMYLLIKTLKNRISIIAVSITGAVCHNMAQLIIAILIVETVSLATLLPWLIVIGIATGLFIGFAAQFMKKYTDRLNLGK